MSTIPLLLTSEDDPVEVATGAYREVLFFGTGSIEIGANGSWVTVDDAEGNPVALTDSGVTLPGGPVYRVSGGPMQMSVPKVY